MNFSKSASVILVGLLAGSGVVGCNDASPAEPMDLGGEGAEMSEQGLLLSEISDVDIEDPSAADDSTADDSTAADAQVEGSDTEEASSALAIQQSADGAINWYKNRSGSTSYEGYCEKAAADAWGRKTRHPSAIHHWNSGDGAKHTSGTAPKGAFVFWNTSKYGHVAVADGQGGAWSTSVNKRIGHITSVKYFRNYLGWKPGNSN